MDIRDERSRTPAGSRAGLARVKTCRLSFFAISLALLAVVPARAEDAPAQTTEPQGSPPPEAAPGAPAPVQGPFLLHDSQGRSLGVLYRFPVQDASKIEENRALAEKLLPAAIQYAESKGLPMVGIQASETISTAGSFKSMRYYGYVWNKEAAGAWNFYVKQISKTSP